MKGKLTGKIDSLDGARVEVALEAIKSELRYQDNLSRRLNDEAKDVPGFLTLLRRYLRRAEDAWADNPGTVEAQHEVRKIAAIAVRAMVYTGVKERNA